MKKYFPTMEPLEREWDQALYWKFQPLPFLRWLFANNRSFLYTVRVDDCKRTLTLSIGVARKLVTKPEKQAAIREKLPLEGQSYPPPPAIEPAIKLATKELILANDNPVQSSLIMPPPRI